MGRSYRLFDPQDLGELLNPLSEEEALKETRVSEILRKSYDISKFKSSNEVPQEQNSNSGTDTRAGTGADTETDSTTKRLETQLSSKLPLPSYNPEPEKAKATEQIEIETVNVSNIVWAEEISHVETGCILLNNWKQTAVVITDYTPSLGARGYEIDSQAAIRGTVTANEKEDYAVKEIMLWPPLALELEIIDKHWQPCRVSDNIRSAEVFSLLPKELQNSATAVWEFIFLLLISPQEKELTQTILETGLSPRRGFFSFMRLSKRIKDRETISNSIPENQRISEIEITELE